MKKTITFLMLLLLPLSALFGNTLSEKEQKITTTLLSEIQEIDFEFYPNPSTGKVINLKISGIRSETLELRIYSLIGSIVYEKKITVLGEKFSTRIILDRQLPQGIYLLSMNTEKTSITKKLRVHY